MSGIAFVLYNNISLYIFNFDFDFHREFLLINLDVQEIVKRVNNKYF